MFMKFNSSNSHRYIMTAKRIIYFCFFFLSPVKLWMPIASFMIFVFIYPFYNFLISFFASLKGLSIYFLSKNKAVIHLTIYNVSFVFLYFVFCFFIFIFCYYPLTRGINEGNEIWTHYLYSRVYTVHTKEQLQTQIEEP